jgi:DNA-binding NarL/FixJ family response regulator
VGVRVLVVDDHRTFTDLVRMALDAESDLECVGTALNADVAREMVVAHQPDVVLLDVNLGADDGLELAPDLIELRPGVRLVVLTAHGTPAVVRRAIAAGACAVLPKDGSLPELLAGLRHADHSSLQVHPSLVLGLMDQSEEEVRPEPHDTAQQSPLTRRELSVLELLARGRDVKGIAKELHISVHTCRGHVKNLLMKLDAHSQLEAVVIAGMRGLVSPRSEE